jgi:L-seryl-tRNA(Ser) seleniumtransferase
VSTLLERPEVAALARRYSQAFITGLVREEIADLRGRVASGSAREGDLAGFAGGLSARLEERIARGFSGRIATVINATGVIVHTNLGRSSWSKRAVERAEAAAAGYCDLEYDLHEGRRGSRQGYLETLLERLFPGQRGIAVNNNAGAVLLALNTLADGKEVVISRGELVEIGGSFRIPEVMARSGAILHEVGTTNRTRLADFEEALSHRTGLLLRVHASNYRIVGFVEEAPLPDLAGLARRSDLPLLVDQGSGNLLDLRPFGITGEPPASALLEQGADLICFSGDKLLGGPQAGILLGREDLVGLMKKNPLYRSLRLDKTIVAALEATLESFVSGNPLEEIPTLRMLALPVAAIRGRAGSLAERIREEAGESVEASLREGTSRVGGGTAPVQEIPTCLLALRPTGFPAEEYEVALRHGRPAVLARVREGRLLLDLRTVDPKEEIPLQAALMAALPRE